MSGDIQHILPPADIVDNLSESTEANNKTQAAFNELMRTPFLQEIYAGAVHSSKGQSVLILITEGLTNFNASQLTDVSIVRKLSGYASTLPLVAGSVSRGQLAEVLTSLVARYVKFANEKSAAAKKFFSEFLQNLADISVAIEDMDKDMDVLHQDISDLKAIDDYSESDNLLARIRARLNKYLKVENSTDDSFIATLALLFTITLDELKDILYGRNTDLDSSGPDIKKLIKILEDFQRRLRDVRILLTALLNNLTTVMRKSISLMTVWFEISNNLAELSATTIPDEKFSSEEVVLAKTAWDLIKADAEKFTVAVSQVSSSSVGSVLELNREIVRRSFSRSTKLSRSIAIPRSVGDDELFELAKKQITADEETEKTLNAMTESSGKIVAAFNKLLKVPFLDSLKVSNSAISGTNADGSAAKSDEENLEVDLETLALNFLKRYQKLQAETVPVARSLFGYAQLQQQLIPLLDGGLSVQNYVNANLSIIEKRQKESTEVHGLHKKFQDNWNDAINFVERAIAEQEENIKGIENTIKDLQKQHKKATIGGIFMILGAPLFTPAAVLSGGILAAAFGAVGVGLLAGGATLASNEVKLRQVINAFQAALRSAKETVSRLKIVLPIMEEIADLLAQVTLIWNDIELKLNELQVGTEGLEALAFILEGEAFDGLKNAALENWKSVANSVLAYTEVVSDVNPEVDV